MKPGIPIQIQQGASRPSLELQPEALGDVLVARTGVDVPVAPI
ncbi:MAG: hypothetical protein R3A52_24375 [Polyangiales bacterium]